MVEKIGLMSLLETVGSGKRSAGCLDLCWCNISKYTTNENNLLVVGVGVGGVGVVVGVGVGGVGVVVGVGVGGVGAKIISYNWFYYKIPLHVHVFCLIT